MPHHGLHFKLLLSVHHFGRRAVIVRFVFDRFVIGGQQGGMEYVVDGPGRWELELISNRQHPLRDKERSMTFGGQLARLIREG